MLLDSGARKEFETGAVRDVAEGKGRCDLLPLEAVMYVIQPYRNGSFDTILNAINEYILHGTVNALYAAIQIFSRDYFQDNIFTVILEVSKHFEEGALKYGERNWQKGIPLHCYIDSAVRHYLKFLRGDNDEPHDRAFMWNILCAIWTHINKPEMIDLPFAKPKEKVAQNEN